MATDPFIRQQQMAHEIWDEWKGLQYTNNKKAKKRIIARLRKMVTELKTLDFDKEFEMLEQLHQLNSD